MIIAFLSATELNLRKEPGVDGSGVEGGNADEDEFQYMALATSSLCNIFFGRGMVILLV